MKFGIALSPVHGRDVPPAIQIAEHRELVTLADQLGFKTIMVGQHFLSRDLRYYQPIPYLTYLSQFAPHMQVGTGILLLPLLNPIDVAEQVATLDAVTGGKAILGLGLGSFEEEFRAFGIPRASRVKRFVEGVELIKAIWSGDGASHKGQFFNVDNTLTSVLPVQSPRPPIWIGAQGDKGVKRAARYGDAWYAPPFPTHRALIGLRSLYIDERAALGLSSNYFPIRREMVIADNRKTAITLAAGLSGARAQWYIKNGLQKDLDHNAGGFGSVTEDHIAATYILGSPEECATQIKNMGATLGITDLIIKTQALGLPHADAMRQLELFGTNVMPLLN